MEATRYMSPINPAVFPYLTTVLLAIGTFFTAWFFVFEGSSKTKFSLHIHRGITGKMFLFFFCFSSFKAQKRWERFGDLQRVATQFVRCLIFGIRCTVPAFVYRYLCLEFTVSTLQCNDMPRY